SANPLKVKPETLADIRVEETIKEGVSVYRRNEQSAGTSQGCTDSARCSAVATTAMVAAGMLHHQSH
ncbi:amidohydrolase, partial [Aeromonas jandaei]